MGGARGVMVIVAGYGHGDTFFLINPEISCGLPHVVRHQFYGEGKFPWVEKVPTTLPYITEAFKERFMNRSISFFMD